MILERRIVHLLLVAVLFFAQQFASLHLLEHEQTITPDETCVICAIAEDTKLGLAPVVLPLMIVSIFITYAIYAYHASPFLTLHNRLAQTRAPPVFT